MRDLMIAFAIGLSFCLVLKQGNKATNYNTAIVVCETDYDCEQMELIEQQRETYYGRENTY